MTRKILKYFQLTIAIVSVGVMGTGCSIFGGKSTAVRGDSGTVLNDDTPTVSSTSPKKTQSSKPLNSTSRTEFANPQYEIINGEWNIIAVGKHAINSEEDLPYIYFDVNDGKFYASNGCNVINGEFIMDEAGEIVFNNVLSTMASCPDLTYPQQISKVVKDGSIVKMKIEEKENGTIAEVTNVDGKKLMTLHKHNAEVLNGEWIVTQIGDTKIQDNNPNIFLDIPEKSVHGNTGCNYFNGNLQINPKIANSISFSQMSVTMKACPNQDIERLMLVALEQTHSYSLSGKTLKFLDPSKNALIILTRSN